MKILGDVNLETKIPHALLSDCGSLVSNIVTIKVDRIILALSKDICLVINGAECSQRSNNNTVIAVRSKTSLKANHLSRPTYHLSHSRKSACFGMSQAKAS